MTETTEYMNILKLYCIFGRDLWKNARNLENTFAKNFRFLDI